MSTYVCIRILILAKLSVALKLPIQSIPSNKAVSCIGNCTIRVFLHVNVKFIAVAIVKK